MVVVQGCTARFVDGETAAQVGRAVNLKSVIMFFKRYFYL